MPLAQQQENISASKDQADSKRNADEMQDDRLSAQAMAPTFAVIRGYGLHHERALMQSQPSGTKPDSDATLLVVL